MARLRRGRQGGLLTDAGHVEGFSAQDTHASAPGQRAQRRLSADEEPFEDISAEPGIAGCLSMMIQERAHLLSAEQSNYLHFGSVSG